MKKLLLIIFCIHGIFNSYYAQNAGTVMYFDYNNVRSSIQTKGRLFWDGVGQSTFHIPKQSDVGTIFASGFWIAGIDPNGETHVAATRYNTNEKYDFFAGPLKATGIEKATTNTTTVDNYNILYMVWNTQIVNHINNWGTEGYTTPSNILNWPGNGDVNNNYSSDLAPYFDLDGNGSYNPETGGDYPIIKGDFAIWGVMNDNYETHEESYGRSMGIEIQYMLYGFSCYYGDPNNLDNTIFLNYKIINRSDTTYTDTYLGFFSDFDIGGAEDDFVGCNVELDTYYGYNADDNDNNYSGTPPAQGIVFLNNSKISNTNNQLSRFDYFSNSSSTMGDPSIPQQYYNYMDGYWKDNRPITFGDNAYSTSGGTSTKYIFPGTSDPDYIGTDGIVPSNDYDGNWTEITAGNTPSDRRGLGISGPFTLAPNESVDFELALVWARGNDGAWSSVEELFTSVETIKNLYNSNSFETCSTPDNIKTQEKNTTIEIYPNPSSDYIKILNKDSEIIIYSIISINGIEIRKDTYHNEKIDISNLENGIYILKIQTNKKIFYQYFIKR